MTMEVSEAVVFFVDKNQAVGSNEKSRSGKTVRWSSGYPGFKIISQAATDLQASADNVLWHQLALGGSKA